jgi:glyoxylase-like metal-dependent hydrolase (beta-lactamase superfamily II)
MSIKIIPLSEGTFTIGHDKIFVPFDAATEQLNDRPTGSLLVEVQPFLLITPTQKIIVDTGLGFHLPNGQLQIHYNLQQAGYSHLDITTVVLSHLHKDHAGGISYNNKYKQRELSFPNAQYYIYKPEFTYALSQQGLSYIADELSFLANTPNINFYNEADGFINNEIQHWHSGGHSKEHQVLLFTSGQSKVFFGGDEASQIKQLRIKYIAKYDYDGKKASELRTQYGEQGKSKVWQFLFYHDVKIPSAML